MKTEFIKDYLISFPYIYDHVQYFYRKYHATEVIKFLKAYTKESKETINFIQIGANDGMVNDPIRDFITRKNWKGVLIEPLPNVFGLLKKNYRKKYHQFLTFLNMAVSSDTKEDFEIWTFDQKFLDTLPFGKRLNLLRKASFNREHLLKFVSPEDAKYIIKASVPSISLNELYREYFMKRYEKLHILVMDTEGHEKDILSKVDFSLIDPEVVILETDLYGPEEKNWIESLLINNNYEIISSGADTIARKCR